MQSAEQCWQELVEQVKKGRPPDDLLRLESRQENFSADEFWQRLVVPGVGDTPLSFIPPDLSKVLVSSAPAPDESVVVLPPCVCLDTVLQPEFAIPPAQLESKMEELQCETGVSGLGKRKRKPSPESSPEPCSTKSRLEPCSPESRPEPCTREVISCTPSPDNADYIDLTQD